MSALSAGPGRYPPLLFGVLGLYHLKDAPWELGTAYPRLLNFDPELYLSLCQKRVKGIPFRFAHFAGLAYS